MQCDYLIVGAGLSGLVLAERLATQSGKNCIVVEKRTHIGGNCHDRYDDNGVLIHAYGPHYFRTNSPRIKDYLSKFTKWHPVNYTIKSYTEGKYWSFPVNLNTFSEIIGKSATTHEFEAWLRSERFEIRTPKNSEEAILAQVGRKLYEKFYLGYTLKQWKRHPRDLDASVCGRIPIRTHADNRYFDDAFQALPAAGYHRMFERMLAAGEGKIQVLLNADYRKVKSSIKYNHLIYTGPIDEYYDCCFGALPYRSLSFEAEHFTAEQLKARVKISGKDGFWQPELQVNYPNDNEFTRIVEMKHATGQDCKGSTIVREFPADYGPGREPYYPIPAPDTKLLYAKYEELASRDRIVSFVGRLATYRYYNMDQIVGMALSKFESLVERHVSK